uniref:Large ribosomal subunit protein uL24c n=1 Tax=Acrochaetium secundatum TaxID=209631 RepID=A0A4D6BKW1_9FLOR|nr:ribosomal protein L24 [Acrochaetium secundatum]QBX88410.1 ribosomal protein L24 [Acrochaetium secundatum]
MQQKKQRKKMHVKLGDEVKIISGSDKGKTGTIIKVFKNQGKIIVKDINMKTKHKRPEQENQTGQIIKIEAPIDSSNVMLYDSKINLASRYKKIRNTNGRTKRVLIKLKQN